MRKVVLLIAVLGLFSLIAVAAETPKAEVFGGYQYTRINADDSGANFNGWNASIAGYFTKHLGVAADFSGAYKSESGASLKVHSYTFGPVVALNNGGTFNPFVHALFGGANANFSVNGAGSSSTNGFTMMIGGGADAKVSRHLAVRLVQADWVYYRFNGVGENNNARVSTGIVFRF